jgi:hypothetical protein
VRDLPLHELENMVEDVEFLVSVRQSNGASRQLFLSGSTVAETISKPLGLQLAGLTNVCAANQNLIQTVDECAIKYGDAYAVGPEVRLGLILSQLVIAVHQHNKTSDEPKDKQQIDHDAREKTMEGL